MKLFLCLVVVLLNVYALAYQVGVGIYDITGPSVEINFMGYAAPAQRGAGIHLRLKARAFAVADQGKNYCFVSVDGGMGSDLVNMYVVNRLEELLGEKIYTLENISVSGTHTHSGPAGYLQYVLFQVTSLGFVDETFNAWVEGISQAIANAHRNLQPGKIMLGQGYLFDSNINRSPTSYLLNPQEERDEYADQGDTDKNMMLLKFTSEDGKKDIGVLNWFAVHGTAMNNTNLLTSGDNRGYASYLLEREVNGVNSPPGTGPFVAAFASTNLGDVSPNTQGAKCIDTGLPCEPYTSTCNGRNELCIAFGPGTNGDMFESTQIIGKKQYDFASDLMKGKAGSGLSEVTGKIDIRHSFVNMPELNVTLADGSLVQLCKPSMGYAFAAGTTDGPGMFGFTQGTTSGNPFWDKVSAFLSEPTEEEIACQSPKPILLNTGDLEVPYTWDPHTVPVQIARIGNVFILNAPGELTTMAGRRLRKAITGILEDEGVKAGYIGADEKVYVTIAGLSNTYSSYCTTYEEYQAQRYEAASTIYGPHTLEAYIQEFSRITRDMIAGRESASDPAPADLSDQMWQLMPAPHSDRVEGKGVRFGDVVEGFDAKEMYKPGDVVSVTFHASNPRHNTRPEGSYLTVEQMVNHHTIEHENRKQVPFSEQGDHQIFRPVAYDGDWSTKFRWQGGPTDPLDLGFSRQSNATISWDVPKTVGKVTDGVDTVAPGIYRICYASDFKVPLTDDKIIPFRGCSSTFQVVA